jgi:retron-type reverse transcriptase
MKTYGNLWKEVTSYEALYSAALRAARGKRRYRSVNRFLVRLEENCWALAAELSNRSYAPGPYNTFDIRRPKRRTISAAPFRDRVVHHALCGVIEPLFDRKLVFDTYANRRGKGTHAAMDRFQELCRRYRYVLLCDVRKYFPSVDHEILKAKLRRTIRCRRTLWLADAIIDGSNLQEPVPAYFPGDDMFSPFERRRGLPVGNLTSQFFANVYLDRLDHFVKERLRCPGYLRYVDDFAVFSDDKAQLREWRVAIVETLREERVKIHEDRCQPRRTDEGLRFLGFRIWPGFRRLARGNARAMARRIKWMRRAFARGEIGPGDVGPRIRSWLAHAAHGETTYLVKELLQQPFVRAEGATS